MQLSNMKVGSRLAVGFGATLLLLVAVAFAGWLSITKTGNDTEDSITN